VRNKVAAEVELKFKHVIKEKELEIDSLQDENFNVKKKFDLLSTEYETFKSEAFREFELGKESHKAEVRDLLMKIQILNDRNDSNVDRETFKSLKQEAEGYRRNFADLQNELGNLRKEKDVLLIEKNEAKLNLLKELESEKMKSSTINALSEKNLQTIKNLENEISALKNKLEDKNQENKLLTNEKFTLLFDLKEKERDFEIFKSELKNLRQKIEESDNEIQENQKKTNDKEKELFLADKKMKEEYESKIEELSRSFKEVTLELKRYKDNDRPQSDKDEQSIYRENEKLKREIEGRKITIEENKKELDTLMERIRYVNDVENENKKLGEKLENKNTEIENLNKITKLLKDDNISYNEKKKREYEDQIKELLKKKNYYKQQVIFINSSVKFITISYNKSLRS
jgi:chromosome segregation ATPase